MIILKLISAFITWLGSFGMLLGAAGFIFVGLFTSGRFFKHRKNYGKRMVKFSSPKLANVDLTYKGAVDLAVVIVAAINFLICLIGPMAENILIVCILFSLIYVAELFANVAWANWKPDGKFTMRTLGHLVLTVIISFHLIASLVRLLNAAGVEFTFYSWFGSVVAGFAWLFPLLALLGVLWVTFRGTYDWVTKIVAVAAVTAVLCCLFVFCTWDTSKTDAQAGDTTKTTTEAPTPTGEEPSSETVVEKPNNTVPDNDELQRLTVDEKLLNEELTKWGLVNNQIDLNTLPQGEGRMFVDAPSKPFTDTDIADTKEKAKAAATELLDEMKVNPVLEANVMIGLQNSEFFKEYAFVPSYFERFIEKDHIMIKRMINIYGDFSPERNIYTLMALTVLNNYNEAAIVEGIENEQVVRINAKDYFAGTGYDLNGIEIKLKKETEDKKYWKYLRLDYYKKNGEKCSLYFDYFDKAFVTIKIYKPKPTEKAKTTTEPTKVPTQKITEAPKKDKITGTPTEKPKTEKIKSTPTPSPTPVEEKVTPTPQPTPVIVTPTPSLTPSPTPSPTPTDKPKDKTKGTQGTDVGPNTDDPGPGEFTGGMVTPVEKSTKEEDKDSTDFTTIEQYEAKIKENEPEPTTQVTPIVTQVPDCEDPEKTYPIEGKIDDNGDNPTEMGIAPIDYGTPTTTPPLIDGEKIKNDEDNPVDKKLGMPTD